MATIKQFEDIEAWKASRVFAKQIHEYTLKKPFCHDYRFKDQIKGSTGSIMDNIAEGFERGGRKEFITFLGYAKGSAGEARSQLHRMLDFEYINREEFDYLKKNVMEISSMLAGLITYLNKSDIKGSRFKINE